MNRTRRGFRVGGGEGGEDAVGGGGEGHNMGGRRGGDADDPALVVLQERRRHAPHPDPASCWAAVGTEGKGNSKRGGEGGFVVRGFKISILKALPLHAFCPRLELSRTQGRRNVGRGSAE